MIWFVTGIVVLVTLLAVCWPLYRASTGTVDMTAEVKDYVFEINALTARIDAGEDETGNDARRKVELERQILLTQKAASSEKSDPPVILVASLIVVFSFSALGLYSILGRPDLAGMGAATAQNVTANGADVDAQGEAEANLTALVERLRQRLSEDPDNTELWMLYARSNMNLGRFDVAFTAYAQALNLTGNNPMIAEELERAKAFAEAQTGQAPAPISGLSPGPSRDDIESARDMSAEDRTAMITGMVDGLSEKLREQPNDPEGWIRLLRSRKVLGQLDKGQVELETMKATFSDQPDIVEQILSASGWR